ncbi:hypothetical protein PPTG_20211 [Phytophthora nicotianae INRA-310]|uniref:C2H2-type domain-containing protein n=3 Tax=Phytophthora nicotianae TaxID=4792 RepID=W2PBG7_PHYN3|nr:hypothetical protein PPTG_20211 [Phytophthora nicotianae INRA-310]ETM97578.1 hypothetical protein PPTG_20211 [Phytophthora nicotianae INRA-310]
MVRRSKKCPKCKKCFATHGNMKRHQDKVNACGAQFVKQRKEVAKRKKSYRNRHHQRLSPHIVDRLVKCRPNRHRHRHSQRSLLRG